MRHAFSINLSADTSVELVDDEAGAKLGLEPGGLGRHDVAGVGYAHQLVHRHGEQGEGHGHFSAVDTALELAEAAYAAHEVDALVGTQVGDAEDVAQNEVAAHGHIQGADRVVVVVCSGAGRQRVPAPFEIQREVVQTLRGIDGGAHVLNLEAELQFLKELGGREAVEVAHHAVVVDNLEMRGGERHGQEVVVLLVAGMVGIQACFLVAHKGCGSRTVMAVGDVEIGNLGESLCDGSDGGVVVHNPEGVAETVRSDEVIFGLSGCHLCYYLLELAVVGEGEEHRLYVGVLYAYVAHAVFLLVAARELMLFDAPLHVVVDVGSHDDAVLRAAVHSLGIYIIVLLVVLYQPAVLLKRLEVVDRFVVDFRSVLVLSGCEVYFGLDYMVERLGVSLGFGARFFAVEHIVGAGCHLSDVLPRRAYALEWFDFCHDGFLFWVLR